MLDAITQVEAFADRHHPAREVSIEAENITTLRVWLTDATDTVGLELALVLEPAPGPHLRSTAIRKMQNGFEDWELETIDDAIRCTEGLIAGVQPREALTNRP